MTMAECKTVMDRSVVAYGLRSRCESAYRPCSQSAIFTMTSWSCLCCSRSWVCNIPSGRAFWEAPRRTRNARSCQIQCKAQEGMSLGKQIETDSLPSNVRELTMKAIDDLGRRVTVGDVATRAGLTVVEAQRALQALAADTGGFLEVSDAGDVLYVFGKEYRSNLLAKSLRLKVEPVINKMKGVGEYLVRVSFGTTLIASLVIVYTSIFVLLSSGKSEDDNRSNRSRSPGFSFYISPFDLFYYWDPYYSRRRKRGNGMNFLESVFSFVFGDGDPNEGMEENRWKAIGRMIAAKGGVVTAEELSPYLDVSSTSDENDDSAVLPVLLRFDGRPEVDSEGNILYRFPSMQRTASNWYEKGVNSFLKENLWEFSKAKETERTLVVALGGFNLFGVVALGSLLKDAQFVGGNGFLPLVSNIFPVLQLYTVAFFAIPLMRWLLLKQRNAEIESRNVARQERALRVEKPDAALSNKLRSARSMAERSVIGKERIIYTTEKDLAEQDYEGSDWEARLRERKNEREW